MESLGYLEVLMSCWSSLLRLKEELCVNPLKARLEKRRREDAVGSAYQLKHSKALPNSEGKTPLNLLTDTHVARVNVPKRAGDETETA